MRLLEQAFSPTTINTGKGTEFEGAIVALSTPQDHWAHSTCLPSLMNQGRTRDSKNQIAQRLLSFVFFQCVELRNALADYFFRKISGEGASLCANPRWGKPPLTIKKMFHETFPISYILQSLTIQRNAYSRTACVWFWGSISWSPGQTRRWHFLKPSSDKLSRPKGCF